MPIVHLTDLSVRALKPIGKNVSYMDDTTRGFGIRVGKHTRTWICVRGRQRERVSFGRYPDLSLSQARAEAKRLLSTAPEPKEISITFAEAKTTFLEENYRDRSPNTKYQVQRAFERHFKGLEARRLSDITDTDVQRILSRLGNRPSEQLHAFRYIRCFFRWCTRPPRRYIKHSPMEGYQPPGRDRKKSRILSDDEIRAVWNAAEKPVEGAVRLLLLWGTRRGETAALARSWAQQDVITIPGEFTKNGRPHSIPVCPLAEHILASLPGNATHYIAGRWGEGHITPRGLSQVIEKVQKASGTHDWTPHDLRRTFRSLAARVGVSKDIAELLMNHAPSDLEEIYDRYSYLPEKREALLKIEAALVWLLAAE